MNRVYTIIVFLLCLQTLTFANYARIPKRLLRLSTQEEISKRLVRKVPFLRTIPGTLPVLSETSESVPDSLAVSNTQILYESLTPLNNIRELQSNSEVLPSKSSDLNGKSKEQLMPEPLTSPLYNSIYDSRITSKDSTDTLPLNAQILAETSPILYKENTRPNAYRNLGPTHLASEYQRLPNNANQENFIPILRRSQPIVKYTLPEMKVLPILTALPILTSLPKVNLMPRVKPQAELLPVKDSLPDGVIFEEDLSLLEDLTVEMNITQEVTYEIFEQKPSKSPILHKVQKIEGLKRSLLTIDRQEKIANKDNVKNMDFRDYYRLVQEKAESFILKPK